jgi:hypothetical protein
MRGECVPQIVYANRRLVPDQLAARAWDADLSREPGRLAHLNPWPAQRDPGFVAIPAGE